MKYYILYDLNDNIICYFNSLLEFVVKYKYDMKELNRRFRKTFDNYINLTINNKEYKLYVFRDS